MKQIMIVLVFAALLAGCSATPADTDALKVQQLQQYKKEYSELKVKIEALEKELKVDKNEEAVRVEVMELTPQVFERFIEVTGRVEAEEDVNISPESAGVIEEVRIKEGQLVSKGQILGVLNTEALSRGLDELRIQYELAVTTYKRQKNLWDQNIGSEMQLLQTRSAMEALEKRIESTQAQINLAVVKSPVNGKVETVYQKKGEIGSPQVPFARIINSSKIRIYADVAESYLPIIKQGDRAIVNFPALGREIESTVSLIGGSIDANNRTFSIRINLSNPDGLIKPNLISTIRLRDYSSDNAIVVPNILIKEDFKGKYTFVVEDNDGKQIARKIYVMPGINNNNRTEIVEGLSAGMRIISEGHVQVSDGTPLKIQG